MVFISWLLGPRLWKCGSAELGSEAKPIRRSLACKVDAHNIIGAINIQRILCSRLIGHLILSLRNLYDTQVFKTQGYSPPTMAAQKFQDTFGVEKISGKCQAFSKCPVLTKMVLFF